MNNLTEWCTFCGMIFYNFAFKCKVKHQVLMIKNYVTFLFLSLSVFLFAQEDKKERIDEINTTPTQLKTQEILDLKVFPNPVSDGILRN